MAFHLAVGAALLTPLKAGTLFYSGSAGCDTPGCGDVFGATVCARILAGDSIEAAVTAGNRAAGRNAGFRGAGGLASHLRGSLVLT